MPTHTLVVLRSLRLLRVFRIFELRMFMRDADSLSAAVWEARGKIVVFLTTILIAVTIMGTAMYVVERKEPGSQFTSIPQAMYWAVVTMTTVGYGDVVPQSTPGKILSTILILLGYSLIIVPTGFVSAEFVGHRASRKQPAAQAAPCPRCAEADHLAQARFCHRCGEKLRLKS
jgi:voltage-gated potassium channel